MIAFVEHDENWLTVEWDDGTARSYPTLWLRDNIPSGRHRPEGQRLFDINAVPADMTIASAVLEPGGVKVAFSPEGFSDVFPANILALHTLSGAHEADALPPPILWGSDRQATLHRADYQELVGDDRVRLDWLREVRDYGYGLVKNTPVEEGTVTEVVDLFGFVRRTNYAIGPSSRQIPGVVSSESATTAVPRPPLTCRRKRSPTTTGPIADSPSCCTIQTPGSNSSWRRAS